MADLLDGRARHWLPRPRRLRGRLAIDGPTRNGVFRAGASFHFSASDIHRVSHAGSEPAVTLHVYSPPLLRMGAYAIGEDGVLVRHPMSYREELRPHGQDI